MIDIKSFIPEVQSAEESPTYFRGRLIGWHVVLFDQCKAPLGGGYHESREVARRIAIAEVSERKIVKNLKLSQFKDDFLLNTHPSTCGFAAGFESIQCRNRAIAEAVERWAWSQWIDKKYQINKVEKAFKISEKMQYFIDKFDKVDFYEIILNTSNIPDYAGNVKLGISLSFKDDGIFPGSRVTSLHENPFEHALVESWRHFDISQKYTGSLEKPFPYGRILYFSKNAQVAKKQIEDAKQLLWPTVELELIKEYKTGIEGLYCWRAIMKNFETWSSGSLERFVY